MASFTKRNGNWRVRIRRTGYPSLTKSFQTKAQAIKWSQDMERRLGEGCTPPFPSEPLVHVSDLLKRYRERVTETKKWKLGRKLQNTSVGAILVWGN